MFDPDCLPLSGVYPMEYPNSFCGFNFYFLDLMVEFEKQ